MEYFDHNLIQYQKVFLFIIAYVSLAAAFIPDACAQDGGAPSAVQDSVSLKNSHPIYLDTSYTFRERAAALVSRMTLAEEVKQLHTNAPAIPRLGVDSYVYGSEGQHGINTINDKSGRIWHRVYATSFPANFAAAMTWDPQLIYRETSAISDEARGLVDKTLWGKSQNNLGSSQNNYGNLIYWAPTINMDRDPRWGRTDEAFGEDPYLASKIAGAYIDGYQGQKLNGKPKTRYLKVASTVKHAALYNVETGRLSITSNASNRAIRDYYMAVFRNLIEKAHLSGIMTSYNAINGTPAAVNTYVINELLRRTYGFRGYITSDCGAINGVYKIPPYGHNWTPPGWRVIHHDKNGKWIDKWHNINTGVVIDSGAIGAQAYALRTGTELNCYGDAATLSNIKQAINDGILSKGVIDRALTDVFTIRMRLGGFDPPGEVPYTDIDKSMIQSSAHQKLAEEVAENTLVLLKNDSIQDQKKRLLPVNPSKLGKVVIVGNLANTVTLGNYSGMPSLKVSAVEGITSVFKAVNPDISVIFDSTGTSTMAKVPVVLNAKTRVDIERADLVVVFVGTDLPYAREANDRPNLAMPGNYDSLIRQVAALGNPNMVLVIQSMGPVKINDIQQKFPAIAFSSYNGESQGIALANVLTGKKNPSGHLNFTWYKDISQLPGKFNYALVPGKTKGLGRTYMYFTGKPTYSFGYGLSYTSFKYSHIKISANHASPNDSVTVSFNVTNTGDLAGATVAQLYVGFPQAPGKELPVKKLEGFQKTKTLQPGQIQHISLTVKLSNLSIWNEKKRKSVVYNGYYQFQVEYNSHNIAGSRRVDIQGKLTPKTQHVTIEPPKLIYHVGETLNLHGKNKWIKSDIDQIIAQPHAEANNIMEAVRNDGSFINLAHVQAHYHSSDRAVATVNANGIVKAVGAGVVTITAAVNGVSGSTVLVVK